MLRAVHKTNYIQVFQVGSSSFPLLFPSILVRRTLFSFLSILETISNIKPNLHVWIVDTSFLLDFV